MVEHPSSAALHSILEGGVHAADPAPVDIVRLEAEVSSALGCHVAALSGGQKAVQAAQKEGEGGG